MNGQLVERVDKVDRLIR